MSFEVIESFFSSKESKERKFLFAFSAKGPLREFAHLKLFDSMDNLIIGGYEKIKVMVPKGLYKLRIELNEYFEEQHYRVQSEIEKSWLAEGQYSALPAEYFRSTNEFHFNAAEHWSLSPTVDITNPEATSSLFIFLSSSRKQSADSKSIPSLGGGFSIIDSNREEIYVLNAFFVKENVKEGWLAFNVRLPHGQYFVRYSGKKSREFPVYLFEQWQTQVFLTIDKQPCFGSLRILIKRPLDGFRHHDRKILELDAILQKMQNGIYYVPKRLIDLAASGKWDDPMLGIIVCYVYFLSTTKDSDNLLELMLHNLEHVILKSSNSPDIKALKILSSIHKNEKANVNIDQPCMFLYGLKAALKKAQNMPSVIPEKSFTEKIISDVYFDTVWTSYKPQRVTKRFQDPFKRVSSVYSQIVSSPKKASIPKKPSWVTSSVFNAILDDHATTVRDLAIQLNLTQNVIKQNLKTINSKKGLLSTLMAEKSGEPEKIHLSIDEIKARITSILANAENSID